MRLIAQVTPGTKEADKIAAAYPEVDVIPFDGGDPPPGLAADAFFGGYARWPDIIRWADAAGVRWVQLSGTGIDKVPREVFDGRTVTCARGASAVPISEWVMAAILAWAKRMPETFLHEPPKHWNFPEVPLDRVQGATVGIVGLGGIGSAIATRALAFEMHVRAMRRTDAPSPIAGVELVREIGALVEDADHVVIAAPATARTKHLVNADVFARMKPGVHLVNIARGALIDQDALRVALDDGTVAMATLDTVDPEPLPEGHWMYSHPRVRVAAHISWYTPQMLQGALEVLLDNLGRFLRDEPLLHVVDLDEGY